MRHPFRRETLPEMPCQELVEVITDYLEGALSDRDRARFEAHLAVCTKCQTYVEQFRLVIAGSGRIHSEELSAQARAELVAAFRGWATEAP